MKKSFIWMVLLMGFMSLSFTSCIERDDDEDNKTYNTRAELIGIGWWDVQEVLVNGRWRANYETDLQTLLLNFKKSRNVTVRIQMGNEKYKDVEAQYTVSGNNVVAKIDNQEYFRMQVFSIRENIMKCKITFVKEKKSYDLCMKTVFAF